MKTPDTLERQATSLYDVFAEHHRDGYTWDSISEWQEVVDAERELRATREHIQRQWGDQIAAQHYQNALALLPAARAAASAAAMIAMLKGAPVAPNTEMPTQIVARAAALIRSGASAEALHVLATTRPDDQQAVNAALTQALQESAPRSTWIHWAALGGMTLIVLAVGYAVLGRFVLRPDKPEPSPTAEAVASASGSTAPTAALPTPTVRVSATVTPQPAPTRAPTPPIAPPVITTILTPTDVFLHRLSQSFTITTSDKLSTAPFSLRAVVDGRDIRLDLEQVLSTADRPAPRPVGTQGAADRSPGAVLIHSTVSVHHSAPVPAIHPLPIARRLGQAPVTMQMRIRSDQAVLSDLPVAYDKPLTLQLVIGESPTEVGVTVRLLRGSVTEGDPANRVEADFSGAVPNTVTLKVWMEPAQQNVLRAPTGFTLLKPADQVDVLGAEGEHYFVRIVTNFDSPNDQGVIGRTGWLKQQYIQPLP